MDHLSELPDEILESIISNLSIKEAAATSILSRRWRHLWKNINYRILDIDLADLISIYWYHNITSPLERSEIFSLMSTILDQQQGSTIHELRIRFPYCYCSFWDEFDVRPLVYWIKTAAKKKVKNLFLQLYTLGGKTITNAWLFHTLPSSFSSLVSLRLVALHSSYSKTLIDYFLLNAPLLEVLCIQKCSDLTNLKIYSLKLRHFTLTDTLTKCLEISTPNLESFMFRHESEPTILFKNVPSLKHISLEGFDSYRLIVSNHRNPILGLLTQLDSLALTKLRPAYITSSPIINFPTTKNLKQLQLSLDCYYELVNTLTPLLRASPELLKVTLINLENAVYRNSRRESALNSRHQCLEVVEMVRFIGSSQEIEFAGYLAEYAASLKKIIIHNHESVHSIGLLQLKRRLPSSVEIQII
ncbi:probable FBD-associated F-box protein At1g32375 [Mercurialis annua]|uniref:probable FBD-associated F-box protein At1g32375 n=1 Tax=Mercurialis annua TaxID=3986 RepID=UPI00215F7E1E|nr:probable FBD-associated F-box protein At1g32375 [Mercurialis annua]